MREEGQAATSIEVSERALAGEPASQSAHNWQQRR